MRRRRILLWAGLVVVLTVFLSGCGGGGGGGLYGGGGSTATDTVQLVACPATGTTDISIVSMTAGFNPNTVTVPVNRVVKWNNVDAVQHTVTSMTVPANGTFNQTVNAGASVCLKFTSAGTFDYHCSIHPAMPTGIVIVQ